MITEIFIAIREFKIAPLVAANHLQYYLNEYPEIYKDYESLMKQIITAANTRGMTRGELSAIAQSTGLEKIFNCNY